MRPALYPRRIVEELAGRFRDGDDWTRASDLERLGGETTRGDDQPPV